MYFTQMAITGYFLIQCALFLLVLGCGATYRPVFLIAPRHPLYWTGYNLFSCSSTESHFGCVCGKGNTLTGSMISLV